MIQHDFIKQQYSVCHYDITHNNLSMKCEMPCSSVYKQQTDDIYTKHNTKITKSMSFVFSI